MEKQHFGIQSIFLISSPLQALACWLIIKDINFQKKSNIVVFTEAYYTLPDNPNFKQIRLKDTRKSKRNIKDNIGIISSNIYGNCELWVSELLWPMNNAVYSNLKAKNKIKSVNFFDEGVVMYFNISHIKYQYAREFLKSLILKFYFKNYTYPSRKLFSESEKNGKILAFNPELINNFKNIEKISIKRNIINQFAKNFIKKHHQKEIDIINNSKKPVLVLAQPYYRVMKTSKFDNILIGLKEFLNSSDVGDLFIKLHPSESLKDYTDYYHQLGFKLVFSDLQAVPVEIILSKLKEKVKVVSFGTSAFINARKFGFNGEMIVYEFEKLVSSIVPFEAQKHITLLTDLYKKAGCKVVNLRSHNV